ncbi:PCP reductase family protein [Pseudanabaena sp. FACHB-1998]|uniref:PCP reductase family protein n=1 Tax=Pseudanabaena sp. FACHB-1998 TaxID=2692858 RepID=UPI001681905A|nr:PCP reductase family protein [Pseudanabaena sp. FACHB-1998]MBD2177723.1 PCP reductase family protein [Pseudanabaena sp. FACHB-1998]
MNWTNEAENKLKDVPFWGRFLVRREVEKFAKGRKSEEVNGEIYDLANEKWLAMSKKN